MTRLFLFVFALLICFHSLCFAGISAHAEAKNIATTISERTDDRERQVETPVFDPGKVTFNVNTKLEKYQYFTLGKPPRFLLDIYDAKPGFKERTFRMDDSCFEGLRIGAYSDKTRFVFDSACGDLSNVKVTELDSGLVVSWGKIEKDYSGSPITLVFDEAEIKNILQLISDVSGVPIMASPEVKGKITLRLIDVPWDQALDLVLDVNQLKKTKRDGIVYIDKAQKQHSIASNSKNVPPSKPSHPPVLELNVTLAESSGNKALDAEETGTLDVEIVNTGKGHAQDVEAVIAVSPPVRGLDVAKKVTFGDIPAGGKVTRSVKLAAGESLETTSARVTVTPYEANGFEPAPVSLVFDCNKLEPPNLILADLGIADQNSNARIEPLEIVELTARIQNTGQGDARGVMARIELGPNVFLAAGSDTNFELGELKSGAYEDVSFSFYTNRRIKNGEQIPVTVQIDESRPRFAQSTALALEMNAPARKNHQVVVQSVQASANAKAPITQATGLSVDVDNNIPIGTKAGEYDIAVVIGNRDYTVAGVPQVKYAIRDARIMQEYLIRTLGFDKKNIIFTENADLSEFNMIFGTDRDPRGKLAAWVDPKGSSRVFVYYTGHGAPDLKSGDAYFVPVNADPLYLSASGYSLATLYKNLAEIPTKQMTVVLDACFSGNSEQGLLFRNISPAMVKTKALAKGPAKAIVFTSAGVDQVSAWYHEKRHSMFTYYFLKALQGAADSNQDRKVTVAEIEGYLTEKVPYMASRLNNIIQEPSVNGDRSVVLAELK